MSFFLFLLVNAVLFVRPADLIPELDKTPIYEVTILACLAVSAPAILEQLRLRRLARCPIAVCVLGLLVLVVLSQLAQGSLAEASEWGLRFLKIVLYYVLFLAVVNTPKRLRLFLAWVALLVLTLTALTLLQYHGAINLAALEAVQQREFDAETGERVVFPRLCGMGIFNDPNDLSVILVVGMMISLSRLGESGATRFLWLLPLTLMAYALTLTHSRGGFLAFSAAMVVLFAVRFGVAKSAALVGALVLGMAFLGGRQTNFDLTNRDDTSQHRIALWRDGLVLLRESPLFGIGVGRYPEEMGLVAHNSYVEAYTELGFFGGTLFLGAFLYPIGILYRLRGRSSATFDPTLKRLRPCVIACATALAVGMFSLSRGYTLTPYLVLGVVTVYLKLAAQSVPALQTRLTLRTMVSYLVLSVAFLGLTHGFVLLFAAVG